jgi:hypothetical protein
MAGGHVVIREFPDARSMQSLAEPLIINCTGLAAGALFNWHRARRDVRARRIDDGTESG